jgi:nicotinate-nucleotide adenylyltransferase
MGSEPVIGDPVRRHRIGIFGGTFDPVHLGHLRTALEIVEEAQLGSLRFIPCAHPPHRTAPLASSGQRVEMLERAIAGVDGFSVDRREIERPGHSYTLETLASLRADLAPAALCLIIGMDAFESFHLWHRWREILDHAHLIVAHRPGANRPRQSPQSDLLSERLVGDSRQLDGCATGAILLVPVTQLDISATALRRVIARGQSVRYLTSEPVRRYIRDNGLYRCTETQ